jgi:hypothetical protein
MTAIDSDPGHEVANETEAGTDQDRGQDHPVDEKKRESEYNSVMYRTLRPRRERCIPCMIPGERKIRARCKSLVIAQKSVEHGFEELGPYFNKVTANRRVPKEEIIARGRLCLLNAIPDLWFDC